MLFAVLLLPSQIFLKNNIDLKAIKKIENAVQKNAKNKIANETYTIKNISILGAKHVKERHILNSIPYKKGQIFDAQISNQAIQNLYALGQFRQVQIAAEKIDTKNVHLYIIVEEKKLLADIKIKGNKRIERKQLNEKLNLDKITAIDEETLRQIAVGIQKMYKEENRHFTQVDTEMIPDEKNPDKTSAVITIDEGKASTVFRVDFKGNKNIPSRKLRDKIFTRENWLLSFMDGAGSFNEEHLEMDKHRIAYLYKDLGYLTAKVTKTKVKFSNNNRDVHITFYIKEGPQYIVRSVEAPGDEIFLESEIRPLISLKEGKAYSQTDMISTINRLKDLWGKKGYIYADVFPQVKPDEDSDEVDITFHVERGNKLYVNRINITGNNVTRDKVIRRELDIDEGELITTQKLQRSRAGIEYLSFFEREGVNWKIHRISDTLADLEMNVREAKTGSFNLQATYGSDKYNPKRSVKLSLGVEKRNLFGLGWDIGGNIQANAHRIKKIEAHFFDPYLFDSDVSGAFNFYKRWDEYDQWASASKTPLQKVLGGNARFGFRFPEIDKRLQMILDIGIEDIEYNDIELRRGSASDISPLIKRSFQEGTMIWLGCDFIKDTRNHKIYPNEGYKMSLSTKMVPPQISDAFSFLKIEAEASSYTSLIGVDSLVLALHLKGGHIRSLGGDGKNGQRKLIPYKELYHMGGQSTVRGYTWGGIGPAWKATGDPLGARNAIQFNAELVFPLIPDYSMKGHFFYDNGSGWNTPRDGIDDLTKVKRNKFDLRHSVGFGLNLMKPVPAKIDWGFKLDRRRKEGESPHEFHLNMNYAW